MAAGRGQATPSLTDDIELVAVDTLWLGVSQAEEWVGEGPPCPFRFVPPHTEAHRTRGHCDRQRFESRSGTLHLACTTHAESGSTWHLLASMCLRGPALSIAKGLVAVAEARVMAFTTTPPSATTVRFAWTTE